MENLTKENFWNELMEKYPADMKQFCGWIDGYKKRIGWENLFRPGLKYHDLPIAMQIGIFMQFVAETPKRYGIEIPLIEVMDDFKKISDIIKDFFFYENDAAIRDHFDGKYINDH